MLHKGDLTIVNGKRLIGGILVPCLVFVACPTSMAGGFSSDSVIVGGLTEAKEFTSLAKHYQEISVYPLLAEKHAESTQQYGTMLTPTNAAGILAETKATAVWDVGHERGPSLHLMPFEVHAVTHKQDWSRVKSNLRAVDGNTLVILHGSAQPEITNNLSADNMEKYWDDLFENYSAVRALGLSDVVYVEPIANDAKEKRAEVLHRHRDKIRVLKKNLQTDGKPEVIDKVFEEIIATQADSDEIALFDSVWKTDLRRLFEGDSLDTTSAGRIMRFVGDLEKVLESEVKPFQCLVTVSTSGGPGADIKHFKSLLNQNTATFFGVSKETRLVERARWTFVSYRTRESESVETGRAEDVVFHNMPTFNVVIKESE